MGRAIGVSVCQSVESGEEPGTECVRKRCADGQAPRRNNDDFTEGEGRRQAGSKSRIGYVGRSGERYRGAEG